MIYLYINKKTNSKTIRKQKNKIIAIIKKDKEYKSQQQTI